MLEEVRKHSSGRYIQSDTVGLAGGLNTYAYSSVQEGSMSASFFSALIYVLGFIGLVAIGVLPLRVWQVLRRTKGEKWAFVPIVLIAAVALWNEVRITARIFRCLTETYCGPGIASGWIYLAVLGGVYLSFEAAIYVLRRIVRARANTQSQRIGLK